MTYRIYLLITSSPRHRVYHRGDRVRTLVGGFSLLLDVEVRDEDEVNEAITTGADVIMLDSIEQQARLRRMARARALGEVGKEVPARDEQGHYGK